MPNWNDLLEEVKAAGSPHDIIRRKYLRRLTDHTGRNAIVYYSGWLQKPQLASEALSVTDDDKNGFMATIHQLDRSLGLDLILHTPGGETAATESLVDYLRAMFGTDIPRLFSARDVCWHHDRPRLRHGSDGQALESWADRSTDRRCAGARHR